MYSVWVSWHDMSCIFLDAEVPCHVTFLSEALYRWHGTYAFFCFFHFADDMGVCVFWVCPTTPMSSAGTIILTIPAKQRCCSWIMRCCARSSSCSSGSLPAKSRISAMLPGPRPGTGGDELVTLNLSVLHGSPFFVGHQTHGSHGLVSSLWWNSPSL